MSWLWRLLPSRAGIGAAVMAALAALITWSRRDARRDQQSETNLEDLQNAHEIDRAVSHDRADPDRLRPYDDAGYRD